MLQRTDNDLWTIPTGGVKVNEMITAGGVRECREETGVRIEITGSVGVFFDPGHVIAYSRGGKVVEVRQPVNRLPARPPDRRHLFPAPDEARQVRWVDPDELADLLVHPAIRVRIEHALNHPGTPLVR